MSILAALHHRTVYAFDRFVTLGPHTVRLRPAPHSRTPITAYRLKVEPAGHFINWQQDPQSNYLARLVFPEPADRLVIEVDLVADLTVVNPFDFFLELTAETWPFVYDPVLAEEIAPFRRCLPVGPRLKAWLGTVDPAGERTIDALVGLNSRVQREIRYLIRLEPGVQSPEQTLESGCGSCRDSAWLLAQILRNLGFASRFVSGYLIQLKPDVKPLEGPPGPEQDFTDLHAWCEVYLPGAGWVGLDPTSGLLAGEGHIPLACTPEPVSAAPITGTTAPCEVQFSHHMRVTRFHEDPRVTLPYTEAQWARVNAVAHRVDADLAAGDVRLTMGGEPTFVSIDDMDGAEWNTAALGEAKRRQAGRLIRRLSNRFASGALLHFGQGKWYPGEQLPRWALSCYWRKDGRPIWNNPELFAPDETDLGHGAGQADRFIRTLTERLAVSDQYVTPGHEDAFYYLWKERRLPANVDPLNSRLKDPQERARLARVFEQGLDAVVGYALPLRRTYAGEGPPGWISGPWFFRPERMYLLPGDSPMGFRLPLEGLPWLLPGDEPRLYERDPLAPRPPLPEYRAAGRPGEVVRHVRQWPMGVPAHRPATADGPGERSATDRLVRTALCVEPRQGRLYVFMPPLAFVEDYLELAAAIEDTADLLSLPVVIEGYHPPADDRLHKISVTPDPGVIEVNVHPAGDWAELSRITEALYEEAHQCRLGTEKFMLDGRHSGTGGGNHIVLGGPRPADSPVLRRPDLLRSLLTCWHNHPSLSYLFSGMFVGPTCQAPRADEARPDMLHELKIAFEQIDGRDHAPPWLVDRVFRHLLTDNMGNTHRAEFCIDKLYSPDSASGRQGLVEFRGFEMPPHARMSLTQQLLLRAMIARYWGRPDRRELIRWDTTLHDRFMLPHFVWQDFTDLLGELNDSGYALEADWFLPHLEFRFPVFGTVAHRGVEIELRQAVEPWYVLGEEQWSTGTVRAVDSSVERIQVRVRGWTAGRYVLTCNGRRVPLHPTGTEGEAVAGVRYRAWQPPSCLHPTVPVDSPLVFDLVDAWAGRSVGGCTYHVVHPGGRAFDRFPVNAAEAESRRAARFWSFGHTPGPLTAPVEERSRMFPLTLDLRREPPGANP